MTNKFKEPGLNKSGSLTKSVPGNNECIQIFRQSLNYTPKNVKYKRFD